MVESVSQCSWSSVSRWYQFQDTLRYQNPRMPSSLYKMASIYTEPAHIFLSILNHLQIIYHAYYNSNAKQLLHCIENNDQKVLYIVNMSTIFIKLFFIIHWLNMQSQNCRYGESNVFLNVACVFCRDLSLTHAFLQPSIISF